MERPTLPFLQSGSDLQRHDNPQKVNHPHNIPTHAYPTPQRIELASKTDVVQRQTRSLVHTTNMLHSACRTKEGTQEKRKEEHRYSPPQDLKGQGS